VWRREGFRTEWRTTTLTPGGFTLFARWLRRRVKKQWRGCKVSLLRGGVCFADSDAWARLISHPVFVREVALRDGCSMSEGVRLACKTFGGEVVSSRIPQQHYGRRAGPGVRAKIRRCRAAYG